VNGHAGQSPATPRPASWLVSACADFLDGATVLSGASRLDPTTSPVHSSSREAIIETLGSLALSNVAFDSRLVRAGDVFVATAGETHDGWDFVPESVRRGAALIIAGVEYLERARTAELESPVPILLVVDPVGCLGCLASAFAGEPSKAIRVVGVTGTNGKSSITHCLAQACAVEAAALDPPALSARVLGTLGAGRVDALAGARLTTPSVIDVHRTLEEFVADGADVVFMEVSSHGLAQGRVAGVQFHTGVFTNLTQDHLDYHGTMSAYGAAKFRLFLEAVPRFAIINIDDASGRELTRKLSATTTLITYGLECTEVHVVPTASFALRGRIVEQSAEGMRVEVTLSGTGRTKALDLVPGTVVMTTPLIGRFNASNLLGCVGALLALGLDLQSAVSRLSLAQPVPGRMQLVRLGAPGGDSNGGAVELPTLIVDFAHTPDALRVALETVREHATAALWCVFGCGGDRDRDKRPQMGRVAASLADRVIVTSDNPRTEPPEAIVAEIVAGVDARALDAGRITTEVDRALAIESAVKHADAGDVVLIAGRGHESHQDIGGRRIPFDDVEVGRRYLEQRACSR
jgi:UDP-N-acetylmuramoyl-L-alanyl-D-glutamate--2,6-diaminopimelate ligase